MMPRDTLQTGMPMEERQTLLVGPPSVSGQITNREPRSASQRRAHR
ncbi:MAG: hypothetical protein JWM63_3898 [Gammaproteobacteria bacterium]|nr:hypothetical protein [Gammaproteobacteria bacterium]